jgi:hypothetical protein
MLKVGSKLFSLVLGTLVLLALIDDCRRKQTATTNLNDQLASSDVSLSTPAEIIDDKSHGNINDRSSSNNINNDLAIMTAFSENHMLEGVAMLRSLIAVQFQGPVYIFLMREVGETDIDWIAEFEDELSKSPLSLHMIDFEVQRNTLNDGTYCFKPAAMGVFLRLNSILLPSESARVVMWSDASTRFLQNPSIWANHIIQKEIDFVGRNTSWSIPQQTHRGTFDYFDLKPDEFNDHPTIAATHFLVNLQRESI